MRQTIKTVGFVGIILAFGAILWTLFAPGIGVMQKDNLIEDGRLAFIGAVLLLLFSASLPTRKGHS